LTTDRPYRSALPSEVAFEMLRDEARGGWCPLSLVDCFIDLRRAAGDELHCNRIAV
jgi:HD-GYP domain-containing protein (c-di-GMP phosphodiesterase class II)